MLLIKPSYKIKHYHDVEEVYKIIASAARISRSNRYAPPHNGVNNDQLCKRLIGLGHESVLEHVGFTIEFDIDRATSHELVRHRMASYTQESQRYVPYKIDDVTFIEPHWYNNACKKIKEMFHATLRRSEAVYHGLLNGGVTSEDARSVLPNATATKIVVTANVREWRHIFNLRTSSHAHPDIRFIMTKVRDDLANRYPAIFDDLLNNNTKCKECKCNDK